MLQREPSEEARPSVAAATALHGSAFDLLWALRGRLAQQQQPAGSRQAEVEVGAEAEVELLPTSLLRWVRLPCMGAWMHQQHSC